jgi:hypothetical protein
VYAPTLFRIPGFSTHKVWSLIGSSGKVQYGLSLTCLQSDLLTGCADLVAMVSCVLAIFTIDRYGRRSVLMVGGAGQGLAMFLPGALSKVGQDKNSASIGAAAGSFVLVYNFIFAVRLLPLLRNPSN